MCTKVSDIVGVPGELLMCITIICFLKISGNCIFVWKTCNYYKLLSIDQFLTFTFKIFHEVNLYPTCGQSPQDRHACLLCGPFKYKTSIRSTSEHQSVHKSFYSNAGRAARANFDALAGGGVNAQLRIYLSIQLVKKAIMTHLH